MAVDGGAAVSLPINGAVTFPDIAPGSHSVALSGLSAECSVPGANPVTVTVSESAMATVPFAVECAPVEMIAFNYASVDGSPNIWIAAPDGSGRTQLTDHPDFEGSPQWSPDGTRLLVRDPANGLTTMNLDGSDRVVIYEPVSQNPMYSPDGSRIAFEGLPYEDGSFQIMLIDPDGTNLTQVTQTPGVSHFQVDWSPDGSQLLYYRAIDGARSVFVMNADGSNPMRLTLGPDANRSPAWSRNAEWIVYSSDRDGNLELYVMRADGSEQTRISNTPGDENLPDWN